MFEQELIDEIEEKICDIERVYYATDAYLEMEFEDYLDMWW